MNQPDVIKIDEVEYVRKDSVNETKGDIKMVVLDRGFVYVGRTELGTDFVKITNGHNIRVWGTTKGLGELVKGPTSTTKLDKVGTVTIPWRAVIHLIDVEQAKWKL